MKQRIRGFEIVSSYENVKLPERKTADSAGYDLAAAEDTILEPGKVTLVSTGLKVYMPKDEYLAIHIRSSMAIKRCLSLINGQGIIDSDYYNNPENEGHIMVAVYNHSDEAITLEQGSRIAQGIFVRYYITDNDMATGERMGGIGSTGKM